MALEKAQVADLPRIVAAARKTAEAHVARNSAHAPDHFETVLRPQIEQALRGKDRDRVVLVERIGGEMAGFVLLHRTPQHQTVDVIWTAPEHRRKGIATGMLDALPAASPWPELPLMALVWAGNTASERLFARAFTPEVRIFVKGERVAVPIARTAGGVWLFPVLIATLFLVGALLAFATR